MFEDGVPLAVVSRGRRLCTVRFDPWSCVHFFLEIKEKKKPACRRAGTDADWQRKRQSSI